MPDYVALVVGTQELFLLDSVVGGHVAFYRDPYGASSCRLGKSDNCAYHLRLYDGQGQTPWALDLEPLLRQLIPLVAKVPDELLEALVHRG